MATVKPDTGSSSSSCMPTAFATPVIATPAPIATATATPAPIAIATASPAPIAMATAVAIPAGPAFAEVPAGGNGGYEQWPPLCDFCSAGNNMCLYATFCLPCLAGHLFTNVLGRPGCCMKLAVLYTCCAIVGFGLYAIGAAPTWMANGDEGGEANGDEGGEATDEGFIQFAGAADALARVMQAVCSALVCYTLIKVSPRATRPRRNITAPAPRDRSARPLSFLFRVPRHTTPPACAQVRQELRNRSGGRLQGSCCEDCMCSYFCGCCTTIQLARYLGWEDRPYSLCSPTGISESV